MSFFSIDIFEYRLGMRLLAVVCRCRFSWFLTSSRLKQSVTNNLCYWMNMEVGSSVIKKKVLIGDGFELKYEDLGVVVGKYVAFLRNFLSIKVCHFVLVNLTF